VGECPKTGELRCSGESVTRALQSGGGGAERLGGLGPINSRFGNVPGVVSGLPENRCEG
jgi:hypothetical protein